MATQGVRPHGSKEPARFRQQAYSIVNDDPVAKASELWGDLVNGVIFLFTESSGDQSGNLMESKLTFVTQADVANTELMKTRYISDPRLEVNERATGWNHPACVIPKHQNVARAAFCTANGATPVFPY